MFLPFQKVSPTGEQEDLFDLILTGDFEFPSEQWDTISEDAKNLIVQMLEVDPDLRLDAESVLEHPWLAVSVINEHSNLLNKFRYYDGWEKPIREIAHLSYQFVKVIVLILRVYVCF